MAISNPAVHANGFISWTSANERNATISGQARPAAKSDLGYKFPPCKLLVNSALVPCGLWRSDAGSDLILLVGSY
jgi:hypothetical protein